MKRTETINLFTKLNELTIGGELEWNTSRIPSWTNVGTGYEVFDYFTSIRGGKILAIYERRYKHYTDYDEFYWSSEIVFCILESESRVIWDYYEKNNALIDLYESVRTQVADLDTLFDDIVNDI